MTEGEIGVVPVQEFPVIGRIAKKIDADIGNNGLLPAMRSFLKETKAKLLVEGKTGKANEVLKRKPVILVANHEHDAEMFALLPSLPDREDIKIIGVVALKGFGENFSEHLIPVYIRPEAIKNKEMKLFSQVGRAFKLGVDVPEDAHERNIQSIQEASRAVKEGGLVIMFPGGARKENIWASGIGYLLSGIGEEAGAYVVKAHISGVSDFDYLRIVPGVRRIMPKLTVTFAEPKLVSDYIPGKEPKEIAKQLQDEYNDWVKELS